MKQYRIGNDVIDIAWSIYQTADLPEDFSTVIPESVRFELRSGNYKFRKKAIFEDNKVKFQFMAAEQRMIGIYDLYLSYQKEDLSVEGGRRTFTIDHKNAFELVDRSWKIISSSPVEVEGIVEQLRGYSAYEIAVKNGFVGTEQEWLESLRLHFSDLTEEEIAELQQPAMDTIDEVLAAKAAIEENELARQANEQQRIANEQAREQNEQAREQNEQAREQNEQTRQANESVRVLSENERITSEAERVNNENLRITEEAERAINENGRIASETARESAETIRITNEDARTSAEILRAQNENTREDKEQTRIENENLRISAEEDRNAAESVRISNENERITEENNRSNAENIRSTNETERQNNEITRQAAETERISNEQIRQDNEDIRETNEIAREQLKDELITLKEETETAKLDAIDAAENANTAAQNADNARLAIQDDLDLKANQTDLEQLAGDVSTKIIQTFQNGDFSSGAERWSATNGIFSVSDGVAQFTASAKDGYLRRSLGNAYTYAPYEKVYIAARVKATSNLVHLNHGSAGEAHSGSGNYEILSGIKIAPGYRLDDYFYYARVRDGRASGWDVVYVDWMVNIPLSSVFGYGNEPTIEEMNALIELVGYYEGTLAQNDLMRWQLKMIRQNRNAIIALGGTII